MFLVRIYTLTKHKSQHLVYSLLKCLLTKTTDSTMTILLKIQDALQIYNDRDRNRQRTRVWGDLWPGVDQRVDRLTLSKQVLKAIYKTTYFNTKIITFVHTV